MVLAPGQVIQARDSYHIMDVIGEGGYAVVYAATSTRHGQVALKEFVPGGTVAERNEVRDLFLREREVLWQLRSQPHLPDLVEAFSQDGMQYLALDLVPGESLAERLGRQGPLKPEEVGFLSLQTARAVAALHAHDVVHHDIKPDNLKLGATRLVVLLDLGSARLAAREDEEQPLRHGLHGYLFGSQTLTQISGTPGYMAPELAEMLDAGTETAGFTLDVFSLGCTIQELVTGKRLEQDEIDRRNEGMVAAAVCEVRERCPYVASPVTRALSFNPAERYASARHLLAELEAVIPPRPAVQQEELKFAIGSEKAEDDQLLLIANAGGGRLSGTVRSEHPALHLQRLDGTRTRDLDFSGNLTAVRVVANGGDRGDRLEEGTILITTPHGEVTVRCEVRRDFTAPRLTVTPPEARLKVTRELLQQVTLQVRNESAVAVRAESQVSQPGIVSITPTQAMVPPGGTAHFCVRPRVRANRPGRYVVQVRFRADGGEPGAPVQIAVEVGGGPWGHLGRRLLPRRE